MKHWLVGTGKLTIILGLGLVGLLIQGCEGGGGNRLPIPPKGFVGDALQGVQLFSQYCVSCHGRGARGGRTGPSLIHKTYESSHHADLAFYMAVKNGVRRHHWQFGDMPPISNVSPEQVGHIVVYIRGEQRKAGMR